MIKLEKILNILLPIIVIIVLLLSVKGTVGNPNADTINNDYWFEKGPFETSNERGRFALMYSVVENKSVKFTLPIAQFATPDLAYKDGEYVSLFAPGVSFISIPGYLIGKALNISQVGAFLITSLFALINTLLITKIAGKLGADKLSARIASVIFLFATPAFSYATTMYQHHISVFIILFAIYSLLNYGDFLNLVLVIFLYALGITVDYPNAIIMAPILIYSFTRLVKREVIDKKIIQVDFNFIKPIALIAAVPPIVLFLWFNNMSYNSPFTLSGTVPRAIKISDGEPVFYVDSEDINITVDELEEQGEQSAFSFFDTRKIINGLDVHIFSSDRGILYYAPVVLLGLIGMIIYGKKKNVAVFWGILGANLILYSMWGDPWGGWTFGSRYLIPFYAITSLFIPFVLKRIRKDLFLIGITLVIISYSVAVNSLGALTSTANPPKIEAQELSARLDKDFKYTYQRNIDLLLDNSSKSFVYNTYLKGAVFVWEYYYAITVLIILSLILSVSYVTLFKKQKHSYSERR